MTSTLPLRRFARLVNGGTPGGSDDNWGGDVQWATPIDLAKVDGGWIAQTERTLTDVGLAQGSARVPPGSVLMSSRAPIGYVAIARLPMAFNQGCKGLVPEAGVDARYLRYWLSAQRNDLQAAGSGSTFMELSGDALLRFPVPARSPSGQRRIADFLDDQVARIDNIIAARREQQDLISDAFTSRLAELFLVGSTVPMRRLVREAVVGIVVQPAKYYVEAAVDGISALRGTNIGEGEISTDDLVRISQDGHRLHPRSQLAPGDVVVVRTGDAGSACVIPDWAAGWNCIDLVIVRVGPQASPDYIEHALNAARRNTAIAAAASGSIQQHFGVGALLDLPVRWRSVDDQADAVAAADTARLETFDTLRLLADSHAKLDELKRSLITAAVTGEFDVSSADGSRVRV